MKVTHERWVTLSFNDTRPSIHAKRIGNGRWTTAYKDGASNDVYLFTKVDAHGGTDYAKEILANINGGNLHLPFVERFDDIDGPRGDNFHVFKTIFYAPLTTKSVKAWAMFKRLRTIAEEEAQKINAAAPYGSRRSVAPCGDQFMEAVIDRVRVSPEATPELVEALELLQGNTANYGSSWWFEFAKRNCAVNAYGDLVLLDCIFDREQVEREYARKRKGWAA